MSARSAPRHVYEFVALRRGERHLGVLLQHDESRHAVRRTSGQSTRSPGQWRLLPRPRPCRKTQSHPGGPDRSTIRIARSSFSIPSRIGDQSPVVTQTASKPDVSSSAGSSTSFRVWAWIDPSDNTKSMSGPRHVIRVALPELAAARLPDARGSPGSPRDGPSAPTRPRRRARPDLHQSTATFLPVAGCKSNCGVHATPARHLNDGRLNAWDVDWAHQNRAGRKRPCRICPGTQGRTPRPAGCCAVFRRPTAESRMHGHRGRP